MDIQRDERGFPTDPALKGAYHLLWVWLQYGSAFRDEAGVLHLEHTCSGAGEDATSFLHSLGLGANQGWTCVLTAYGLQLMGLYGQEGTRLYGGALLGWEEVYLKPRDAGHPRSTPAQ